MNNTFRLLTYNWDACVERFRGMHYVSDVYIWIVKRQHCDKIGYFVILINIQLFCRIQKQISYVSKEHIESPEIRDIFICIDLCIAVHYNINNDFTILKALPSAALYRWENIYVPNCTSIDQCSPIQLIWWKYSWNRGRGQNCICQFFDIFHLTPIINYILCGVCVSCRDVHLSLQLVSLSEFLQVLFKWRVVIDASLIKHSLNNTPRPALQNIRGFNTPPSRLYTKIMRNNKISIRHTKLLQNLLLLPLFIQSKCHCIKRSSRDSWNYIICIILGRTHSLDKTLQYSCFIGCFISTT